MTVDGRPLLAHLGFHPFSVLRKIMPALFPAGKRALLAPDGTFFLLGVPAGLSSFFLLSNCLLLATTPLALDVDHIFPSMTAGDLSYHSRLEGSVGLIASRRLDRS